MTAPLDEDGHDEAYSEVVGGWDGGFMGGFWAGSGGLGFGG